MQQAFVALAPKGMLVQPGYLLICPYYGLHVKTPLTDW